MSCQKNELLRESSEHPLEAFLIAQLRSWFFQNSDLYSKFTCKKRLGSRQKGVSTFLVSKKDSESPKILKSFESLNKLSTWKLIAFELVVPILIKEPSILRHNSVFIFENVGVFFLLIFRNCTSSTTTRRAGICATFWIF